MCDSIDSKIMVYVTKVVNLWCKITGRTNVALAKLLLYPAAVGKVIIYLYDIATEDSSWMLAFSIFFFPFIILIYSVLVHVVRKMGEHPLEKGDVIPLSPELYSITLTMRRWTFYVGVAFFLPSLLFLRIDLYSLLNIAVGSSLYIVFCTNGGGKSVFARAKDWFKENVRLPQLVPQPVPVRG